MNFEETMRVTNNSVTLTKALWQRIGTPEYLSFGYDDEEKAIALRVATEDDPNATVPVKYKTGGVHINNAAFLRRKVAEITGADLSEKCVVFRRGFKVGEWFVFELRNADIVSPVKKKVMNA